MALGQGPFSLGCCCQGNEPPEPPAGCCCLNGASDPTITSEIDCLAQGGTWYPDQDCADVDCTGGGGGCVGGCDLTIPPPGQFSPWWEILASSYDRTTGDWVVIARTLIDGGYSSGRVYSVGGANAAIVTHTPPANGFGLPPYPANTTVTITGTSDPPTPQNCGDWEFGALTFAVVFLSYAFTTEPC